MIINEILFVYIYREMGILYNNLLCMKLLLNMIWMGIWIKQIKEYDNGIFKYIIRREYYTSGF